MQVWEAAAARRRQASAARAPLEGIGGPDLHERRLVDLHQQRPLPSASSASSAPSASANASVTRRRPSRPRSARRPRVYGPSTWARTGRGASPRSAARAWATVVGGLPAGHQRRRPPGRQAPHDRLGAPTSRCARTARRRADGHAVHAGHRRARRDRARRPRRRRGAPGRPRAGRAGRPAAPPRRSRPLPAAADRPRRAWRTRRSLAPRASAVGRSAAFTCPLRSLPVGMSTRRILPP